MFRHIIRIALLSVVCSTAVTASEESVNSSQYRQHLTELVVLAQELSGKIHLRKPNPVCTLSFETETAGESYILAIRDFRGDIRASAEIPSRGTFKQTHEAAADYHTETTEIQASRYATAKIRITTFDDVASFDLTIMEMDGNTVRCSLRE